MASAVTRLLAAHAALPEPYQPAWGLDASRDVARRGCDDRLAVILSPLEALACERTLRILDLGCAQGYFTLAIAHALVERGRDFEIVGVDSLEENIRFCEALAAYHGLPARFVHARVDSSYLGSAGSHGWDVVLALNVLHHVQHQQGTAAGVLAAIRTNSRVTFCELAQRGEALEWVGEWHATDDQLLGAYTFRRRLGSFPTHLGDVRRPLYVCSDTQAWVGDRWFEFDHAAERSHAGVPDAFVGERRFLFGRTEIVKAYRGEGRYGTFNRAELDAEAAALASLADEPDRYPAVLARCDDGDTVWLARGLLRGRLLSTCIDAGDHFDRTAVVRGLLGELAHLESRGFHHGDLRCWNVLLDGECVRLIDFGALVAAPSPLHRIALEAVLLEIADGKLRHDQPFYAALHPLSAYPAEWHGLVRYLVEAPQHEFCFAHALDRLDETPSQAGRNTVLAPASELVVAAAKEQVDGFRRLREHLADFERRVVAADRESADAVAERAALESARHVAEVHAISLTEALSESQRYADSLDARIAHEAADAAAHLKALELSRGEVEAHARSLQVALEESKRFVAALQARVDREAADAGAERKALEASRRESEAHALSLAKALAESQAFADSLQARVDREAADAGVERKVLEASRRESEAHALSLVKALAESQAFADSLQARVDREAADAGAERKVLEASRRESEAHALSLVKALAESQAFASSLQERVTRETADVAAEREAMRASQRDAAAHAAALERALAETRTYAGSLKEALEGSQRYADSLYARLEREAADAHHERAELTAGIAGWQARYARMQRRFRLLKFMWPRDADHSKEPE